MSGEQQLKSILKSHNLHVTDCRINVMQYFLDKGTALSQKDLEKVFVQFDRVTLYRTLNSFLETGIIHQIPNSEGAATYGLSNHMDSADNGHANHVHFKCKTCGAIACLEDKPVPFVDLPNGYVVQTVNVIVEGVCIKCT